MTELGDEKTGDGAVVEGWPDSRGQCIRLRDVAEVRVEELTLDESGVCLLASSDMRVALERIQVRERRETYAFEVTIQGRMIGCCGYVLDFSDEEKNDLERFVPNFPHDKVFNAVPHNSPGFFLRFGARNGKTWTRPDPNRDFCALVKADGIIRELGFHNDDEYRGEAQHYRARDVGYFQKLDLSPPEKTAHRVHGYSIALDLRQKYNTQEEILAAFNMSGDSQVFYMQPGAVLPFPFYFYRDQPKHLCITPCMPVKRKELNALNAVFQSIIKTVPLPRGSIVVPDKWASFPSYVFEYESILHQARVVLSDDTVVYDPDPVINQQYSRVWHRWLMSLKSCVLQLDGDLGKVSTLVFRKLSDWLVMCVVTNAPFDEVKEEELVWLSALHSLCAESSVSDDLRKEMGSLLEEKRTEDSGLLSLPYLLDVVRSPSFDLMDV